MNQVFLIGRLTKDPELKFIQGSGTAVATFTLAVDREYKGKDGNTETDFINIEVWNKIAETCANSLSKGSLVAISGSLQINSYKDQQGSTRYSTRVRANRVKFLESKNKQNKYENSNNQNLEFEPFDPTVMDPNGFQAVDDEDLPF